MWTPRGHGGGSGRNWEMGVATHTHTLLITIDTVCKRDDE